MATTKHFGLIINPIAGMGGKVALKGTDGAKVLAEAYARGARPEAMGKAETALKQLIPFKDKVLFHTVSGSMGGELCEKLQLPYKISYNAKILTSDQDTIAAGKIIASELVQLMIFVGGDGTARNVYEAVEDKVPVLGIPAGVKIQSAVFAKDPETAGTMLAGIVQRENMSTIKREVVDLDENAYRTGHVSATLYGYMQVPNQPMALQSMKESGFTSEQEQMEGIAYFLEKKMESGIYYAIGLGSTAKCISRLLGIDYELLGIDVIKDKKLIAKDVTEETLWQYTKKGNMRIIVSPIGGQGFLFGRGNHQFSPRILEAVGKDNIIAIASEAKLISLKNHQMYIDTGDVETNKKLEGYYNVLCGYGFFHSLFCK